MKITIYGSKDCPACQLAQRFLPQAEYRDFPDIFDEYDFDIATGIVAAGNGNLPTIVIEDPKHGRLVLEATNATWVCASP